MLFKKFVLIAGLIVSTVCFAESVFKPLRIGEVKPQGWLRDQLEQDVTDGYLPVLPQLTEYIDITTFNAAAKAEMFKPKIGAVWWSGEQTGCWLDGYIRSAYLSGNAMAKASVDALVEQVQGFQEADGYLGVYPKALRYESTAGWQDGNLWAQATLFRGLLAYYELTGRQEVLGAVQRAVDLSISMYDPERPFWRDRIPRGGPPHSLMFIDICEWMHRLTGEPRYMDFAQWFFDSYNESSDVFEYDVLLRSLANPEQLFNGHGVHVMEHVRVPYWLHEATGDEKYAVVEHYPIKIPRHINAGGAVICDEDILQRMASPAIGCEYCTMTELVHSSASIFEKTGAVFAGDWMEHVAFNAAQGARMKDGRAIAYLSSDNQPEA
jgi:uncharacterized protein